MIIWGSRGRTSLIEGGQFHCPQCGVQRGCGLKEVRRYFTLYFIPLIPLDKAGRYVECNSCGGTFAEEAMLYDPEKERQEMQTRMLRVMIMAALADGQVDNAERAEINKQYTELAGLPVSAETLNQEISLAVSSGTNLNAYVRNIAETLSAHGKALVVKLAFCTMSAAAQQTDGQQQQLAQLADTLQIPADQFRELVRQLSEAADEEKA
ncbi:MAG: DUF533 domain-containing protein [Planctomycetales bacterium]|nr:DUF533 domain-containing protein [Planctomycetales bacterium]